MSSLNWILFASAILPVVIAILVYYFGVKIARRSEEKQQELERRQGL